MPGHLRWTSGLGVRNGDRFATDPTHNYTHNLGKLGSGDNVGCVKIRSTVRNSYTHKCKAFM